MTENAPAHAALTLAYRRTGLPARELRCGYLLLGGNVDEVRVEAEPRPGLITTRPAISTGRNRRMWSG
jgi:hypothetical protein